MQDLRQSHNWAEYLQTLGWSVLRVGETYMYYRQVGFGSVIKIQRPTLLSLADLKTIDDLALKTKALFVKVEPGLQTDTKNLIDAGYTKNHFPLLSPSTIHIDLTKTEAVLWQDLKPDARYSVNRAKKVGLKVTLCTNPSAEDQRKLYDLIVASKKPGLAKSLSDITTLVSFFKDRAVLGLVMYGKEIVAANLLLGTDDSVFYLYEGLNAKGRKHLANYLLVWETLKYLKGLGYKTLDLEGIYDDRFPMYTTKWFGFSYFKKKFGGEEIKFEHPYIKVYSKVLKILNRLSKQPLPL